MIELKTDQRSRREKQDWYLESAAKIKIKGLGGTELNPAVKFILKDKRMKKNNLLILTDGEIGNINLIGIKKTIILTTTNKNFQIKGKNYKIIKIKD